MSQVSKATRVSERAGAHILKGYERARSSLADIPLGEKKLDPRTEKKRAQEKQLDPGMDTTLTRLLYQMRSEQPNSMESQQ